MTGSRQDSSLNSTTTMVHPFLISGQSNFARQNVNVHDRTSPCLGLLPGIHRPGGNMSLPFHFIQGTSLGSSNISQGNHALGRGDTAYQAHGLSLSLGSHPQVQYRQRPFNSGFFGNNFLLIGEDARESSNTGVEHINHEHPSSYGLFGSSSSTLSRCSTSGETWPFSALVGNSRYLKPTQCLLQELVNVNVNDKTMEKCDRRLGRGREASSTLSSELKADLYNDGILPAEKSALQFKIVKLIALLEEVEKRYEKYHHHMEDVVSSLEGIVGPGSAKLYTAQPLQAMTRHFSFLSDEILSQIYSIRRRLSRESTHNRLSLQQIGFYQNQRHAWRPIRGLPETSVAILRAWLFEHFLHPYPNDPEKLMLASQTGLTKNQVSNWFINARVRLWKPMIEEMYKEEVEDSQDESSSFLDNNFVPKEDT